MTGDDTATAPPRSASETARQRVHLVQVLSRHQVMIQAYARAITGDVQLAEDVYQEVAIVLAQDPARIPDEGGTWPWLREVTRRKALEVRRRQRRTCQLAEDVVALIADDFAQTEADALAERRSAMSDCIEMLTAEQRAIVAGRYCQGQPCEEIAAQVGRTVQAVYAVLKRVRLALHDCVERRLEQRA
jgi:RNA polymerase sigma-70 factor (ECF subfamily)